MTDTIIARGSGNTSAPQKPKAADRKTPQAFSAGPHIPGLDDPMPDVTATSRFDPSTGEVIDGLPGYNADDPASLEAFFGNFGYAEHFRKVVLATCREAERAKATLSETKISEARLDDLARSSDIYVSFLITNLEGRRLREKNVFDSNAR